MTVDLDEARQSKRRAFEDLLSVCRIYLTLDTRVDGVKVPGEHQGKAALTLLFGRDLPVALEDLYLDDTKIAVTLSFQRKQHHCVIPWDAVWYIVPEDEHQGIIFEPSLPAEARKQIFKEGGQLTPLDWRSYLEEKTSSKDLLTRSQVEEPDPRRRFQVIDGDALPANSDSLTTEENNDEARSRPVLTLVTNSDNDTDGDESDDE